MATVEMDSMYCFAPVVERGVGKFFEQAVDFAIEQFVALQNGGLADRLR
jgi:hypothetical protein